ncbi:MAG: bifunctional DNA primase/polymerase [Candidatus Omnitrophica bacterium]|nr:bifunctional DNA primase/polymerase [Candidatus Omnitrophota bacterium]
MIEQALKYAKDFGWAVFPIAANSKIPHKGSRGFKDASADPDTIIELFNKYPDSNIAVATGAISGIFVLDVDDKNGYQGSVSLEELEKKFKAIPKTVRQITPSGGRHYFFKYPENRIIRSSVSLLGPGLDIRAEGGYVVLPPSTINDKKYDWEKGFSPYETSLR